MYFISAKITNIIRIIFNMTIIEPKIIGIFINISPPLLIVIKFPFYFTILIFIISFCDFCVNNIIL